MKSVPLYVPKISLMTLEACREFLLQTAAGMKLKSPLTHSSHSKLLKQDLYVPFAKAKVPGTFDAKGRPIDEIGKRGGFIM